VGVEGLAAQTGIASAMEQVKSQQLLGQIHKALRTVRTATRPETTSSSLASEHGFSGARRRQTVSGRIQRAG